MFYYQFNIIVKVKIILVYICRLIRLGYVILRYLCEKYLLKEFYLIHISVFFKLFYVKVFYILLIQFIIKLKKACIFYCYKIITLQSSFERKIKCPQCKIID